jgi:hypothetical protein
METKMVKWYADKAILTNIFLTLIGVLTLVAEFMSNVPELLGPGIIMLVVGALNIIMRIWLTAPIETPKRLARIRDVDRYSPR